MTSKQQLADHWLKRNETLNAFILFEGGALSQEMRKRLVRTVLIFTESSDQLSRATDRVPGLPASPGYVQ
ncbi:hypothetical protein BT09C9_39950 [Escherichia coli]